jgi:hypothetical protein
LATETGFSHSTVAAVAYGTKKPVYPRGPNARSTFMAVRMAEENAGTFLLYSHFNTDGLSARGPGKALTLTEFDAKFGHKYYLLPLTKKLEYIKQLKRCREEQTAKQDSIIRKLEVHTSTDIRTTSYNIINSTATLPKRAGYAIIAFGARTDYSSSSQQMDIIPKPLKGFWESLVRMPPTLIPKKRRLIC